MIGVLKPLLCPTARRHGGQVAASTFQYYPYRRPEFAGATPEPVQGCNIDIPYDDETSDQVVIHNYGAQLEQLLPIKNAITTLLDIETFEKISEKTVKNVLPGVHSLGCEGLELVILDAGLRFRLIDLLTRLWRFGCAHLLLYPAHRRAATGDLVRNDVLRIYKQFLATNRVAAPPTNTFVNRKTLGVYM